MRLLHLAPEILAELEDPDCVGPVPTEKQLRVVASLPGRMEQVSRYRELVVEVCVAGGRHMGKGNAWRSRLPRKGIQHQLSRARRFEAALASGEVSSLAELGRREGLTGGRIAQLLNLLHLAPEILVVVDVPNEELPR